MMATTCCRVALDPLQPRSAAITAPEPALMTPPTLPAPKTSFIAGPQRVFSGQVVSEYPPRTWLGAAYWGCRSQSLAYRQLDPMDWLS